MGDMQESIQFAVYKVPKNQLLTFVDESQMRWVDCDDDGKL